MEMNRYSSLPTLAVEFLGILWSHIMSVETTQRGHITLCLPDNVYLLRD